MNDKKISREIEILENASLYKLAEAVVDAYDFNFDHCFGFYDTLKDCKKKKCCNI